MNTLICDKRRYSAPGQKIPIFQVYFRKYQMATGVLKHIYRLLYRVYSKRRFIEIPRDVKIGPGLYIGHPNSITINSEVVIGSNCNIHRGVTIGRENRGTRKGAPTIGNNVWIGINSTIVGEILVGDDVLIAPNTYINCDIPSHTVVFGNPCQIKERNNATEGYINSVVDIE